MVYIMNSSRPVLHSESLSPKTTFLSSKKNLYNITSSIIISECIQSRTFCEKTPWSLVGSSPLDNLANARFTFHFNFFSPRFFSFASQCLYCDTCENKSIPEELWNFLFLVWLKSF